VSRPFLDANILFSGAWGSPAVEQLLRVAAALPITLLTSRYALEEAYRNLDTAQQRARLEQLATMVAVVPETTATPTLPVSLDTKDRPIMQAAAFAGATHLVTGDGAHFGLLYGQSILGVRIVSLRQYLREAAETSGSPGV
jgi:predicted nucleic acid-binding protein